MPLIDTPVAIAILDDYQNVALQMADWSRLEGKAKITVFNDHVADTDALVERLKPFDILCVMGASAHKWPRSAGRSTCRSWPGAKT